MSACTVPPPGWTCRREAGHEGPCAALPEPMSVDTAIHAVNDNLGVDAAITVRGDEVKYYVWNGEGGRDKTYLDGGDCRKLAAAFAVLAESLGGGK